MTDCAHGEACRIDVWLWRARFLKTRTLAAAFVEAGKVRLGRPGQAEVRLDKASRTVRPGDLLVFVLGGRVIALTIAACGERRGPPAEARSLYVAAPVELSSPEAEVSGG